MLKDVRDKKCDTIEPVRVFRHCVCSMPRKRSRGTPSPPPAPPRPAPAHSPSQALLRGGVWRWMLPVRVRNLCLRSSAQGLFWTLLAFPPTILVLWMFVQNGEMSGLGYTIFKGIWAMFFVVPVFFIVFFAGLDKRNFPELEFEALMRLTAEKEGTDTGPPLVGQVGHV